MNKLFLHMTIFPANTGNSSNVHLFKVFDSEAESHESPYRPEYDNRESERCKKGQDPFVSVEDRIGSSTPYNFKRPVSYSSRPEKIYHTEDSCSPNKT